MLANADKKIIQMSAKILDFLLTIESLFLEPPIFYENIFSAKMLKLK